MKDPIKIYPAINTPYSRPLPLAASMATALADMGNRSLASRNSTYTVPAHGIAAFIERQRVRATS